MWHLFTITLFIAEILLLAFFIFEWTGKKQRNHSLLFLILSFCINFALYAVAYGYSRLVIKQDGNAVLDMLEFVGACLKAFVGEWRPDAASNISESIPFFTIVYTLGSFLAPLATVNVALQAFNLTIRNRFRLRRTLRQRVCNIVLGTSENAIRFAQNSGAVIIPEKEMDRDGALRLMERGFPVIRKAFCEELLAGKLLTENVDFNIICPGTTEENLKIINTFISYLSNTDSKKNIKLYVQIEDQKAWTIRKEIIQKSQYHDRIFTFCPTELLSLDFAFCHPITEYMPQDFLDENKCVKKDKKLNVIYIGYNTLNREMYNHFLLNNHLVTYENGEYLPFVINYHLFDLGIDESDWLINGVKKSLSKLATPENKSSYHTLPPLSFDTTVHSLDPYGREALSKAEEIISQSNSFTYVIVDAGDTYKNIEAGTRLRNALGRNDNYHVFIRSKTVHIEDDAQTTYLAGEDSIFTQEHIINDTLFGLAYKINEYYTRLYEKDKKDSAIKNEWEKMERFTKYSNLYAALNLRLKLHLLGFDFAKGHHNKNAADALKQLYVTDQSKKGFEQFVYCCAKNTVLAAEKYRWNAYHLLNEITPMPISEMMVTAKTKGDKTRYKAETKNFPLTKHACLTTYSGLVGVAKEFQRLKTEMTGLECKELEFENYTSDDILIACIDMLYNMGFGIVERPVKKEESSVGGSNE